MVGNNIYSLFLFFFPGEEYAFILAHLASFCFLYSLLSWSFELFDWGTWELACQFIPFSSPLSSGQAAYRCIWACHSTLKILECRLPCEGGQRLLSASWNRWVNLTSAGVKCWEACVLPHAEIIFSDINCIINKSGIWLSICLLFWLIKLHFVLNLGS